jgi:hypothetical protein
MKILLLTLFLSFSSIGISYADFQNGMNAFDKGEYKVALKEFKPLANHGDIDAQNNLDAIYEIVVCDAS